MPPSITTVIFIANPFGYGPAGRAVALMGELAKSWDGQIVYAASDRCQETLTDELKRRITIVTLDERNQVELTRLFQQYTSALVVVNSNRVAITTAKRLGMPAVFIDSLAWMWKSVPAEYLLADTYYYYDIFNAREKLAGIKNAIPIPPALGTLPLPSAQRSSTMVVHIGGFSNPFGREYFRPYLQILAEVLRSAGRTPALDVVGGASAIRLLAELTGRHPHLRFTTLGRNEFIRRLACAGRFVTTPGLTATLEAFVLGIPTAFLPPSNLSQWELLRRFATSGVAPIKVEWEDCLRVEWDCTTLTERTAMERFAEFGESVHQDASLQAAFVKKLSSLMTDPLDTRGQWAFGQRIGRNGSSIIVGDIIRRVGSAGS